ncbi:MAG: DUF2225 domain-containing protein [Candidatus Lindowbacteria bacterium]|nr:DUF2225 domain-containing protein [Candidatus Lindowbacteria bacterium]
MNDDGKGRLTSITFAVKKKCPQCDTDFDFEKSYSKKISPTGRDVSLKNQYGEESNPHPDPIIYSIVLCPHCLFAAFEPDFEPIKAKASDMRIAKQKSKEAMRSFAITNHDLIGLRDLRVGLVSYYIAENWYRIRSKFSIRRFRLALCLYRRAWLLDATLDSEMISPDTYLTGRLEALSEAETFYEQAYLKDRIPDKVFCGPDFGVDFGQVAMPYLVAYINYCLGTDKAIASSEQVGRLAKSRKFLSIALTASGQSNARELRTCVQDLQEMVREQAEKTQQKALSEQEEKTAAETSEGSFAPRTEFIDWDIHFSALFEKHGDVFQEDDVVVREGEPGTEMFFILNGKVNIVKAYDTEPKLLARLGDGAFFGEMALLDESPRFASVIATEETRVVRITRDNLKMIIQNYPEMALRIMEILTERLRNYHVFVKMQILPLVNRGGAESALGDAKSVQNQTLITELQGLLQEIEK